MSVIKHEPRKRNKTICEYLKGRTCTHPRCIRGCGNECNAVHKTRHGTYKGKEIWFHR